MAEASLSDVSGKLYVQANATCPILEVPRIDPLACFLAVFAAPKANPDWDDRDEIAKVLPPLGEMRQSHSAGRPSSLAIQVYSSISTATIPPATKGRGSTRRRGVLWL